MVNLPGRLGGAPNTRPQGTDVPRSTSDLTRDLGSELSVTSINADARGASGHAAAAGDEGVQLDAAIEAALAAAGVDPVTQVRLEDARGAIRSSDRRERMGFDGENLAEALFRFVMPRLKHPEVLHVERHRTILEQLARGLAKLPDDPLLREGAVAIHRELRYLAGLREGRSSIIEG